MNINYNYAIISFCSDLTNPNAGSLPVGMIGIGKTGEDAGFVMSITPKSPDDAFMAKDDPFSKQILSDLDTFLSRQLEAGLNEVGPDNFLEWLHHRLRNSIHVSIIDSQQVKVKDQEAIAENLMPALMADFMKVFTKNVEKPLSLVRPTLEKKKPARPAMSLPSVVFHPTTPANFSTRARNTPRRAYAA